MKNIQQYLAIFSLSICLSAMLVPLLFRHLKARKAHSNSALRCGVFARIGGETRLKQSRNQIAMNPAKSRFDPTSNRR